MGSALRKVRKNQELSEKEEVSRFSRKMIQKMQKYFDLVKEKGIPEAPTAWEDIVSSSLEYFTVRIMSEKGFVLKKSGVYRFEYSREKPVLCQLKEMASYIGISENNLFYKVLPKLQKEKEVLFNFSVTEIELFRIEIKEKNTLFE